MPSCLGMISDLYFKPAELKTPADVIGVVYPIFKIWVEKVFDNICHVNRSPAIVWYFLVIDTRDEFLIWSVYEQEWICH
jgi:hypothetical protein